MENSIVQEGQGREEDGMKGEETGREGGRTEKERDARKVHIM